MTDMNDLTFDRVSKKYDLRANGDAPETLVREGALQKKSGQMWAVRNISFPGQRR